MAKSALQALLGPHAMLTPAQKVEDFNPDRPAEVMYAKAMDLITEGRALEGKNYLEDAFEMGSWRAGNALAYGLSVGWFGERDYPSHLTVLWNLVEQGSSGAMNNIGFAYDQGLGLRKSLRWAVYWYEKAAKRGNVDAMGNLAGTFEVAVGKWIEEYPQAYQLILEEFNLPPEKTKAMYAIHWDIGQSWR